MLESGFAWNGGTYESLSKVARAITGTNWNGPRFFGLRDRHERHDEEGAGSRLWAARSPQAPRSLGPSRNCCIGGIYPLTGQLELRGEPEWRFSKGHRLRRRPSARRALQLATSHKI